MPTKATAPKLHGWISLTELAVDLGVSRQAVHQMADDSRLETLCWAGGDRPTWLITQKERDRLVQARTTGHDDNDEPGPGAGPCSVVGTGAGDHQPGSGGVPLRSAAPLAGAPATAG